ncbi:hypothetical protein [uncultured Jatrophihabitans sp.]|uniref:hypothetical protein n=1 Tax=uncultured Jatrophihabitans sp. TaxID=1610747 RepID=UPI0035C99D37
MNVPSVLLRHRSLRWLAPAGVVAVAGLVATGFFQADAKQSTKLPHMTPSALLADVRSAGTTGFSGTILSRVSLGLPELPSLGTVGGDADSTSFTSLLSGSHTLQVWYGGADEQRIALLGAMDETDVFRSGRQLWTWNSSDRIAQHAVLPAGAAAVPDPVGSPAPTMTPSALSSQALAALSPTTRVSVRAGAQVADRNVYDLVLTPRTSATRVGSVHISVDASTKLPLAVRVYARGERSPAVDVAYTSVRFTAPSKSSFTFSPPAGATVHTVKLGADLRRLAGRDEARVVGAGWTRVVEVDTHSQVNTARGEFARALTPVSGSWGHGGLLESSLVSVLVTSTGRVFAGSVDPSALYAAAAAK